MKQLLQVGREGGVGLAKNYRIREIQVCQRFSTVDLVKPGSDTCS
jgi:hypothetical protein